MEGRRAPQGLGAEDRVALGLTATHLSYLVVGSLAGYATLAAGLPGWLKYPVGVLLIGVGALLAWGRLGRRSLDTWAWLAARYYVRPRRSPAATTPAATGGEGDAVLNVVPRLLASGGGSGDDGARGRDEGARSGTAVADRPSQQEVWEAPAATVGSPGKGLQVAIPEFVPPAVAPDDTDAQPEPRILTLPSLHPRVADGSAEYRVDGTPAVEPLDGGGALASPPVFLAATQRVAFFSLKGGTGKTTLATEVAAYLARRGQFRAQAGASPEPLKVALVDLDLGSANISMRLGLTHPTLWDLVLDPNPGTERIEECLLLHRESGLRVLLGPPRAIAAGEARTLAMQRLAAVLRHLEDEGYHFVFLDLPSEVDEVTTFALEAAQQVYYVMTPTASGVQDTYRGVATLRRMGHRRKLRFVLNAARAGFSPDEILADLGGTLSASIPSDDAFTVAEDDHEPACLSGSSAGVKAVAVLAASIYPGVEAPAVRARFWQRLRHRIG